MLFKSEELSVIACPAGKIPRHHRVIRDGAVPGEVAVGPFKSVVLSRIAGPAGKMPCQDRAVRGYFYSAALFRRNLQKYPLRLV